LCGNRGSERVAHPFHPIPKTNKSFSGEDARTHISVDDVKPCGHSGLIHGFNLSTTTDSTSCYGRRFPSNGWNLPDELTEICGLAAKDHSKIKEGEVKGHQLVLLM
jgi:hypothetical protein